MKDKLLLSVSLSLYILGAAALMAELFNFTPASADAVSSTAEVVHQTGIEFEQHK